MSKVLRISLCLLILPLTYLGYRIWEIKQQKLEISIPDDLRSGDIIFTRGYSWRTWVVLLTDTESQEYSHVGVLLQENGGWSVIHATPNLKGHRVDMVIKEPLHTFLAPEEVSSSAVYRLEKLAPNQTQMLAETASIIWEAATPFDHKFDFSEHEKLYCTELVWKVYQSIGLDLVDMSNKQLLMPSALLNSTYLKKIIP